MIAPQPEQPDSTEYPEHWTPWITRADASPIAGLTSGLGIEAEHEHTADANAYPANWNY